MIDITLYGVLGKKLGKHWLFNVESIFEIFEAIEANTNGVSKYFKDLKKFASHFIVYVDGKLIKSHLIKSKILNDGNKVEILPIIQGSGPITSIIIGVVLMALSYVVTALLSPKAPKDIKTSSSTLGGIKIVVNRNIVIPVGYGRLRVGSAVISNNITIQKFIAHVPDPADPFPGEEEPGANNN